MTRKRIWAACRPALMAVGLFSFFVNLLMLTVPLYMLQLFDRVLTSRSVETLAMLTVVAAGALIVLGVLEAVRSRILVRVSAWLERSLSPAILSRAVEGAAATGQTGRIQGLRDLSTLRGFLSGPAIFHLFDAPWVPLYIAVIFLLHPWLGGIALGGAILLFLMALLSEATTRKPLNAAGAGHARMLGRADSHARNAEAIEAMGMLPGLVAGWQADGAETVRLHQRASDRAGLLAAATKVLRLALQIAILATGVYLAMGREITPGAMIAASIILSRALAPVEQMIGTWRSVVAARAANRRIGLALEPPAGGRGTTRLPVPEGRIDVEHATVVPPGGVTPVLQRIHFSLEPGESLGVIGPSAAGKSSLARLLVGVWRATAGKARLDGADLFTWNREDLGRHIGYLPQDVELLDGTVKQNIARMGEPDDASVVAAARLAGAHDMLLRLPMGYDTLLGDDGFRLSGGQRQRLGLARAFYGNPRLLILDEPNANLDADGEQALAEALAQARTLGITVVIIAHRPSVLAGVDKLLVLRDGRMELFGARDEVMARVAPQRPKPLDRPSNVASLQTGTSP